MTKPKKAWVTAKDYDAYCAMNTETTAKLCCTPKSAKVSAGSLRFQYGKKKNGQWYWHIRAKNSEIIAQGEGYKRSRSCIHVAQLLLEGMEHMSVTEISR